MSAPPGPDAGHPAWTRARMESYFRGAVFVLLLVLGAIAAFRLYFALEQSIITWLEFQYVPLAQAAFSAVMLALVVWLMRSWVIARAR